MRATLFPCLTALSLMLAGCAVELPLPASTSGGAAMAAVYKLGNGDKFRLNVFNEPSLSGSEFAVNAQGEASLPLIGVVKVGGLTMREAETEITRHYAAGYLTNPKVNIDVVAFRPFYILGEIKTPGEYPYTDGMTMLNAVAKAGGFTYRAYRTVVYVRHADSGGEQAVTLAADTPVLPGDTLRIIERVF
jgi:protein involved in polysaccharide export with SLBB domain